MRPSPTPPLRRTLLFALTGLLASLGAAAAPATPDGILIEAEDFEKAFTTHRGDFAKVYNAPHASSGKALIRFVHSDSHATWNVDLPESGLWRVWLRYTCNGTPSIGVAFDSGKQPDLEALGPLPSTSGLGGKGAWRWGKIYEGRLEAGARVMAVRGGSYRPDCFFFTMSDRPPTDDVAVLPEPFAMTPEIARLLERPYPPAAPDFLEGALDYELPAWFEDARVQAHTRLSPVWMKRHRETFFHAAESFRRMGFPAFTRHIVTGNEGAWWPSSVGAVLPDLPVENVAKTVIDNAHEQGLRIIVYYRHFEDAWAAETHPEWLCRGWDGEPIKAARGLHMCLNTGYADFVQTRQLELVDMGADGFYYDNTHMPPIGCWCPTCRRLFKEDTGLEPPAYPDESNPVYKRLIDFNNLTMERAFLKWRKALHAANPEVVMLVSLSRLPSFRWRHMSSRLARIADSAKTEFMLPAGGDEAFFSRHPDWAPVEKDARVALGYAFARDGADGRPGHVWTHGVRDETAAVYATAGMITHGMVANLDVGEGDILETDHFNKAIALGNRVSPAFAGARPLRWAAVHVSERAKDAREPDADRMWKEFFYPTYGAFATLLRDGLPVNVIVDSQLEQGRLDGYEVLYLPTPDDLTDGMTAAVERFAKGGGLVISPGPGDAWAEAGGCEAAAAAVRKAVAERAAKAPVRVLGGPETMHAVSFVTKDRGRLTVSLANDFTWVPYGRHAKEMDATPPPPIGDAVVLLRGDRRPKKITNAVTGRALEGVATPDGLKIAVPPFEAMAVAVVEY